MRLSGRRTGKSIELGDKVTVEINNVSVVRRRIDFTLVRGATVREQPKLETSPRATVKQKKKVGHAVDRAQPRKAKEGDKLRLGVSHRGAKKKRR